MEPSRQSVSRRLAQRFASAGPAGAGGPVRVGVVPKFWLPGARPVARTPHAACVRGEVRRRHDCPCTEFHGSTASSVPWARPAETLAAVSSSDEVGEINLVLAQQPSHTRSDMPLEQRPRGRNPQRCCLIPIFDDARSRNASCMGLQVSGAGCELLPLLDMHQVAPVVSQIY